MVSMPIGIVSRFLIFVVTAYAISVNRNKAEKTSISFLNALFLIFVQKMYVKKRYSIYVYPI